MPFDDTEGLIIVNDLQVRALQDVRSLCSPAGRDTC